MCAFRIVICRMRVDPICHGHLVDVPPVPVILEPLPQHGHDLVAGHHVVGQVGEVGHLRAGRAPRVVGRGFSNLRRHRPRQTDVLPPPPPSRTTFPGQA